VKRSAKLTLKQHQIHNHLHQSPIHFAFIKAVGRYHWLPIATLPSLK